MRIKDLFKISMIIVAFSLIVSILIVGCVYFWQDYLKKQQIASSLSSKQTDLQDTNLFFIPLSQVQASQLDNYYYERIFQHLPALLFVICLCICLMSTFLWFIIRKFYTKQAINMISDLAKIEKDEPFYYRNTPIGEGLQHLKNVYQNQLNDYKRLGSYLSHDLKNSIAVLKLSLGNKRENQRSIQYVDQLINSVENILTLTSDSSVIDEEIDIVMLCADICDSYRKSYPQIEFVCSNPEETMLVQAKRIWLTSCIRNLVDNSIKYGKEEVVKLIVEEEETGVIVMVKDKGIGLSDEQKEKIYDYKYRVSELQADGYGIGLSVVKYAVRLCQGSISVDSVVNQGTTFKIWLPKIENKR